MRQDDFALDVTQAGTGSGAARDIGKYQRSVVHITGTFVATVQIDLSIDGTNFKSFANTTTTDFFYELPDRAYKKIRIRVSAWTSGQPVAHFSGYNAETKA